MGLLTSTYTRAWTTQEIAHLNDEKTQMQWFLTDTHQSISDLASKRDGLPPNHPSRQELQARILQMNKVECDIQKKLDYINERIQVLKAQQQNCQSEFSDSLSSLFRS